MSQLPLPSPNSALNVYPERALHTLLPPPVWRPLPVLTPPPALFDLTPTDWFVVDIDGWHTPTRDGWYDWRRVDNGEIDRLWWSTRSGRVMAVSGNCPPMVWNAWRGCVGNGV